ncbi:DNA repair protein RadA [Psychroflexus halocasei]|uniref:DNA repair protein RadA n=1 Tax=Psychroflexus halocasei TaxID=908615 RepID=A0A1H3VTN5_9FLAO|nr:DNA repair protein RadA [Psychroflexus halocasei]SDZ78051.1 DNA repair protein RadA/Sms [Psychroflexus halocasei]
MAKTKTLYYCQSCGAQYAKWQGQCNACKEWNTLAEEIVEKKTSKPSWDSHTQDSPLKRKQKPTRIADIKVSAIQRMETKNEEFNRVLGGGLVPGSVTLLGGEPGIGKSTLLLQLSLQFNDKVLYVSGEESQQQIKLRAERISDKENNCYILSETKTQHIFKQIGEVQPDVLIIDSIQTLHTDYVESSPGSVSQVRECAAELIKFAKETNTPVLLIGHINKEGSIAGPKVLEHMVDTVLQFEGDRNYVYRILRAHKNRYGSTHELGIFEMQAYGLKEVKNPSDLLISKIDNGLSGTAIAATLEGIRPLMIEIQALVSTAVYGTPQRSTTGYHVKRLNMLLAVLEKRAGFKLGAKDVFLNITGGIHVDDPAIDLAVVSAILSSNEDEAIPNDICFAAEVGLAGEIRPVTRIEQRVIEAEKLGFGRIVVSKQAKLPKTNYGIEIYKVSKIQDLVKILF